MTNQEKTKKSWAYARYDYKGDEWHILTYTSHTSLTWREAALAIAWDMIEYDEGELGNYIESQRKYEYVMDKVVEESCYRVMIEPAWGLSGEVRRADMVPLPVSRTEIFEIVDKIEENTGPETYSRREAVEMIKEMLNESEK